MSFFVWIYGLLYAANNTIQSHAYIFNNFGGTFIVIGSILAGKKLHKFESIGSFIALSGAFVTLLDSSAQTADGKRPSAMVNLIDLAASAFGGIYFVLLADVKKLGPLFFQISLVTLSSAIFGSIVAVCMDSSAITSPFDMESGLLGIYSSPDIWWYFLVIGVITGHFISIVYFLCSQIFSGLLVSSTLLLEPFIAQLIGVGIGIDLMPGVITFVGTVVTCAGLYMSIVGG
jgi:hypothetical protein